MKNINHKNTSINQIAKLTGLIFFIFSMIPWVNFGSNTLDSQPWPILTSLIFLFSISIYSKIKLPPHLIKIFILVILGLLMTTFFSSDSLKLFTLSRAIVNYFTIPILYVAFYNYFVRYQFPSKLFLVIIFLWIFIGFLELYIPEISEIFSKIRTSGTRGVTSLAPEPTFFAIFLFFSSWIYLEANNLKLNLKIKILILINFLVILFLAKSATVLIFYIVTITGFIFSKVIDKGFISKYLLSIILGLSTLFIILIIFINEIIAFNLPNHSRHYNLLNFLFSFPTLKELIGIDASVNQRVEAIFFSIYGAIDNFFLPGGLDTYIEKRNQLISPFREFFFSKPSGDIMSWIGAITYELGIFGILILTFLFFAIYREFKGSLIYYASLFVILLSAVPVAFPLIPMLISLMVISKEKLNLSDNNIKVKKLEF